MKCCSMIFWTSCGCDTSLLIVMRKLDLLMFHVQRFCCFKYSSIIFSIFYFSYEVFCSFFFGISNFLIHLFQNLFPLFYQLFVLLWVFTILNLKSYVLLLFWHAFKIWIWYLVLIYFLLVPDMSFCHTFDYVLELFPFVLWLCCYVFFALNVLLNLLSIFFLVFFILCKLSCVEPLLTSVGHPLMVNSCPCQFYSGNGKSLVRRCFCPSVWMCIGQDFLVLLIQDNIINLIVYRDSLICYQVSSALRSSCDRLLRVLEAAVCNDFIILSIEFHQTKLVPFWFLLSLDHCPIQLSAPVPFHTLLLKSPASIVIDDGILSNSLHSLSTFLYSFLSSFGHFLAWFEVRAYTFILLMILSGFILILLILILQFPVYLHSYCGPLAQVSGFRDSWRTQILSDSLQYLWIDSSQFFGTTKPLPNCLFFESKVMIILSLTLCIPAFSILVSCRAHTSTPYWFTSLTSCSFFVSSVSPLT